MPYKYRVSLLLAHISQRRHVSSAQPADQSSVGAALQMPNSGIEVIHIYELAIFIYDNRWIRQAIPHYMRLVSRIRPWRRYSAKCYNI